MLIGAKGNNYYEVLFTTATVIITVGFFAYFINKIGKNLYKFQKVKF